MAKKSRKKSHNQPVDNDANLTNGVSLFFIINVVNDAKQFNNLRFGQRPRFSCF